MPQYHVDSEQIAQSSSAVSASVEQIRSAVHSMYAYLTALDGSWHGAAAQQFNAIMQQWRTAQSTMEESLQSIQHSLGNAAQVYADAENQARSLFAQ